MTLIKPTHIANTPDGNPSTLRKYTKEDLDKYMEDDYIIKMINSTPECDLFASQRWLKQMPAKRMIYSDVYGNLLKSRGQRILDIGSDFCGMSKTLLQNHDYEIIDIMIHGGHGDIQRLERQHGKFWVGTDWYTFNVNKRYDIIICNDLLPNADQRLEAFIDKFLPHCDKIVTTLTCYDSDRFYEVTRVDAEERLTIKPWTSELTDSTLARTLSRHCRNYTSLIPSQNEEDSCLFENERIVYRLEI